MNDYHSIAEQFEKLGFKTEAKLIEDLHSKLVSTVMLALEVVDKTEGVTPEQRRDLGDFVFQQRSYR